jgi:CheY-like chemotaxis protein
LESLVPTRLRSSLASAGAPEVPVIIVGMPILSVGTEQGARKSKNVPVLDDDWPVPSPPRAVVGRSAFAAPRAVAWSDTDAEMPDVEGEPASNGALSADAPDSEYIQVDSNDLEPPSRPAEIEALSAMDMEPTSDDDDGVEHEGLVRQAEPVDPAPAIELAESAGASAVREEQAALPELVDPAEVELAVLKSAASFAPVYEHDDPWKRELGPVLESASALEPPPVLEDSPDITVLEPEFVPLGELDALGKLDALESVPDSMAATEAELFAEAELADAELAAEIEAVLAAELDRSLDFEPDPGTQPSAGKEERPPRPSAAPSAKAPVVMVVEDDASIREMLTRSLGTEYCVYEASDGVVALDMLARMNVPDLLLLDVRMPRMDGLALAGRVRQDTRMRRVPIIFLSGLDAPRDVVNGINAGARHYLTKPFKMKDLMNRVGRALSHRAP